MHKDQYLSAATERMVDYDHHSDMQNQLVLSKAALLGSLVEQIGRVKPEFTMVDYGCGPGHSAIDTVRPVVEAYRRISQDGPMVVRHADQPGNDWNALLALAFGPHGYQRNTDGIRTEAAIGSFYTQMAAPCSVSLATCFMACHWLSRSLSLTSPGTLWFADLDGEARATMVALARSDWTQFLRCRAQELRPGAFLIVSILGSVPDAAEKNGVRSAARKLYRALYRVAHEMVDDGLLMASALDRFVFPLWFPTVEEARDPIDREPDLAEAFAVIEAAVDPVEPHPNDVYEDLLGDRAAYAKSYVGYIRGFGESTLRLHLFSHSAQGAAETDALNEEFFRRLTRLYEDETSQHASETLIMTIVLRRR
jgi:hypothetical protein